MSAAAASGWEDRVLSFIGVAGIFLAPFLVMLLVKQEWVPERTTSYASGNACATVREFYEPPTDASANAACQTLDSEPVTIADKVFPPDYDKYPEGAAARARAYRWSQIGGGETLGEARLKEHTAEQAASAAYERAQREWGDKPKLPILLKVIVSRGNRQLFLDESAVHRVTEGGYYSPSTAVKFFLVLVATAAGFGGFFLLAMWESRLKKRN